MYLALEPLRIVEAIDRLMRSVLPILALCSFFLISSCSSSNEDEIPFQATPFSLENPPAFQGVLPAPLIPANNSLTEEGIALGKRLFFDPILSSDGTISCASCHRPEHAFSDPARVSVGVNGALGTRNSMPLHNLAWNFGERFAWDGSANSLEAQVFEPVTNPSEMNNTWSNVEEMLQDSSLYPDLFQEAFGTSTIDSVHVSMAIAQFMRTLVSADSKFDRFQLGEVELTEAESNGLAVFLEESRGDCFHCHGLPANPLWTDNAFHNNGLDAEITDRGLGDVTGDPREFGLFRSPSLRNLAYTAPYMHDGRFATLEEVIDHYSEGLQFSETIDPLMKQVAQGGVQLSDQDKADLKAFLLTLSDPSFINNPDFLDN